MRKISLTVIGLYLGVLSAFSQQDSAYKNRTLKPDEINFVTSYYNQDGNHSPVTGGIGTEKLSDFASTFEIKMSRYKGNIKHSLGFELGIDHYTSASSDKIDPHTISSASHADTRIYPSASYTIDHEQKGNAVTFNGSFSHEFDYTSFGAGVGFTKTSTDKNTEFSAKLQAYLDNLLVILPVELRTGNQGRERERDYPSASRNSFSSSLIFSQSLTERLQLSLLLDLIYQDGYLSTPFHRIYFTNGTETNEKLPSSRFKIPAGIRLNYFIGDKVIIRTFYRYYHDDWGLNAQTFNIELPVKISSFLSVSPFYRYYSQNGVKYFAPYMAHVATEQFYTTDDDLSKFNSNFIGAGIRFAPPGGVFKLKYLNALDLRYGHYNRTDGLHSDIITLALKFK